MDATDFATHPRITMSRKHRWAWVTLFVLAVLVLGTLAAGWNFVLVQQHYRAAMQKTPWLPIVLGALGFSALLAGLILFFVRLLQEMRLNQRQSEFIATVSHELKTPIATMELTSSLLRAGEISAEESERLWASHDAELKRLREEVEALLEAARWQAGAVAVVRAPIELESWIGDAFSRWRGILGPGSRIERVGDPLPVRIVADPKMLALITDNLIDNARKFSDDAPCVQVDSRLVPAKHAWEKPRWEIRFRNEGWGFDPADADRIFRRFTRARTLAPHAIPGTGLGLYLAATASRAMGLRLRGESPGFGRGAVFTLEGRINR